MYKQTGKRIPDNEHNRSMLKAVRRAAEQYLEEPILSLPYSRYRLYDQTGSRVEYEADYIAHRRRLNVFAAMALSSDEPCWLSGLCDIIWAICDEFSWAFPAHIRGGADAGAAERETTVDLFCAETGFALSEIYHLLGQRLPQLVCERLVREVRRRVIAPFLTENITWGESNWSAVCAAGVGAALIYVGSRQEFEQAKAHLYSCLDDFLNSYQDDGCCLEGPLYWSYGFGYFTYIAALLRDFTGGETDLFQSEKVHTIARFWKRASLEKTVVLPFADAPHNMNFNIGLLHFLCKEYSDMTPPDSRYEALFGDDIRYRYADFIRNFFWYDPALDSSSSAVCQKAGFDVMPVSQWYVARRHNYTFACKGGHNDEPHNHNDLGSFIVYSEGHFIFDDLGWSEYYNGYFGPQRYDNICASSRGHSVPIVDGVFQSDGAAYRTKMSGCDADHVSYEMAQAYDLDALCGLGRRFDLESNGVLMTDVFTGDVHTITERFVTRVPPSVEKEGVYIGSCLLCCDTEAKITVASETFSPRLSICKMDMQPLETAYLIDFHFAAQKADTKVCFRIILRP